MEHFRNLRTIPELIRYIKSFDSESAVTRYMIMRLVKDGEVFSQKSGNQILVDRDEILRKIGVVIDV